MRKTRVIDEDDPPEVDVLFPTADDAGPLDPQFRFAPTSEPPGSAAKVEIFRERYRHGHPVFHPGDNGVYSPAAPVLVPEKNYYR